MQIQNQSTPSLIEALKNRDVKIRRVAALILGKNKAIEAIIPLVESMHDGLIRDEAAIAICNFGNLSLNPLLQLLKHPQSNIRMNAAFTLGKLKNPLAIKPLIALLGDPSEDGFAGAYLALGNIGKDALDDMRDATKNPNPRIRKGAAFALGEIIRNSHSSSRMNFSPSIDDLLKDDEDDDDYEVVDDEEIDDIDDIVEVDEDEEDLENDDNEDKLKSDLIKKHKDLVIADLLPLLKDPDVGVQKAASTVLGSIGMPSLDPITQNLNKEDRDVRKASIRALGEVYLNKKTPEAIPPLIEALTDNDPEIRFEAAKGLRYSKDPRTLQPFIECLHDSNQEVRKEAAEGLRRRNDPKIFNVFLDALDDNYFRVRWTAACALGEIGNPEAKERLLQTLKDDNKDVREIAAISLGRLGIEANNDLNSLSKSNDSRLRGAAATGMGETKDGKNFDSLIKALKDPNAEVRRKAAEALCKYKDPRALDSLIAILNDSNSSVRKKALRALSKINDKRVLSPMLAALKDRNAAVRSEAVWHLGDIGDERAILPLIEIFNDSDKFVCHQAAIAIGNIGGQNTESLLLSIEQNCKDPQYLETVRIALEHYYRQKECKESITEENSDDL